MLAATAGVQRQPAAAAAAAAAYVPTRLEPQPRPRSNRVLSPWLVSMTMAMMRV